MYEDDEDEEREKILEMLGGEVDEFAGKELKDPNEKPGQGVTIEISVKPHGEPDGDEGKLGELEEEEDDHDPIAHILGMCSGGKMCNGGMAAK